MGNHENTKVRLDWSRLLGFDQAAAPATEALVPALSEPRLARLGAKLGPKPGLRVPA